VQNSGTANRVTVLKEEPKPVPDFLSRDWVVDPNLSLGEVQVGDWHGPILFLFYAIATWARYSSVLT
jgi:hypothetical protein